MKNIAWGITGAGHFLEQCIDLALACGKPDVYLSGAAEEIIGMYGLQHKLFGSGLSIFKERSASSPQVGKFYRGKYGLLVVAPATSNSVSKFVSGISDSLITNIFAHAGKSLVPAVVLPSDAEGFTASMSPSGPVKVFPRKIDLDNIRKLKQMENVTVVSNVEELSQCLKNYL